jgi:hypothetical protein
MLTGCDRVSTAMGNTSHDWLKCFAICPAQYKDGKEKILSTRLFSVLPLWFSMQGLARDVAEVAELREDMTRVQAAAVMARACATQAEGTT